MLFFKRYLEKQQLNFENFENAQVPCYYKMRELPAPKKLDYMDDLVYNTAVLYKQYIEDWLMDEYIHNHDNDYLVSLVNDLTTNLMKKSRDGHLLIMETFFAKRVCYLTN